MTDNACFDIDYENLDDLPLYEHIEWHRKNPKLFTRDRSKLINEQKEKATQKNSLHTHLPLNSPNTTGS